MRLVVDGVASDLSLETQLVGGLSQMGAMMADAPTEHPGLHRRTDQGPGRRASSSDPRPPPWWPWRPSARPDHCSGREDFKPSSFSVAGFAVIFAFLTAQTTASSIFDEKREGTFRRLLAAPTSKWELLAGKMLPNFVDRLSPGGDHLCR